MADSQSLRRAWEDHPHYRYRGCAPDADDPRRMAGDPRLPLGAHHAPDVDGGEGQAARVAREAAAVEVCLGCPVMVACDAYASSVTRDGKLAEPDGVWGGRTALERHRAFIARRHEVAAPVAAVDSGAWTEQRLRVLRALAGHAEAAAVAAAAGVDVRTANWQRSRLVTLLRLSRSASRREVLAAAVGLGLLERSAVVRDDGTVPAIPPPSASRSTPSTPGAAPVAALEPRIPAGQLALDLSLVLEDAA